MKFFCKQFLMVVIIFAVYVLGGCGNSKTSHTDDYLIRVEDSIMTVIDFKKALDIARTAYPYDIVDDHDAFSKVRLQLLKELCERMIVLERARELDIEISDSQVEKAIADIKSGYPEGEFKQALLEIAVSYDSWKDEIKTRMIMEKVVAKELGQEIAITDGDIAEYYKNEKRTDLKPASKEVSEDENEMIAGHLHRKKTEQAYKSWIKKLREKYTIQINEEQWKKILLE